MLRNLNRLIGLNAQCHCSCKVAKAKAPNHIFHRPHLAQRRGNSTLIQKIRMIPPESYVLLVFPCISFYLGVWQIKRRKWKVELIEELERKQRLPGAQIPSDLLDITPDREYETYILEGEFDHSRETFVGPRVLLDYGGSAGGLISSSTSNGVHVVTPLKLSNRQEEVLVNRGWISRQRHRQADVERPTGEQRITGVYRTTEKGTADGGFDKRTNMWSKRNISLIAESLDTSEHFFDMCESNHQVLAPNSPVPGQTNIQLRNEHMSYIITWFSLALLMILIWCNRFLRVFKGQDRLHSMINASRQSVKAGKNARTKTP